MFSFSILGKTESVMCSLPDCYPLQDHLANATDKVTTLPDCGLKQVLALNHLILKAPTAATGRGSQLVIVTECYREYNRADIPKHFNPFAALIQALGVDSNQLISDKG